MFVYVADSKWLVGMLFVEEFEGLILSLKEKYETVVYLRGFPQGWNSDLY